MGKTCVRQWVKLFYFVRRTEILPCFSQFYPKSVLPWVKLKCQPWDENITTTKLIAQQSLLGIVQYALSFTVWYWIFTSKLFGTNISTVAINNYMCRLFLTLQDRVQNSFYLCMLMYVCFDNNTQINYELFIEYSHNKMRRANDIASKRY